MEKEITRLLFEKGYTSKNKADSLEGYLYMRYLHHFLYHARKNAGLDSVRPADEIDEAIDEMIQMFAAHVGDAAMSYDTNIYHAKVTKLEDAKKLVTLKEDINVSPSKKVMPYTLARDVIIENPDSIAVGPCPCRAASKEPCLPPDKEICLFLGDPHASFIAERNPKFRKISQSEAVEILTEAHELGFVQNTFFEKPVCNRMNAICNCCSCCCAGIVAWNMFEGAVPVLAPSGYLAQIAQEACTGCGECVDACPFNALSQEQDADNAVVSEIKCMGCGVCEDKCPVNAISLRKEPSKGDPLDVDELLRGEMI